MSSGAERIWLQLHWPRPVTAQCAEGLLHRIVADPTLGRIVCETRATNQGAYFLLGLHPSHRQLIERLLEQLVPGLQIEELEPMRDDATPEARAQTLRQSASLAARITVCRSDRLLNVHQPEAAARRVLAACAQLRGNEQLVLQLQIGRRQPPTSLPRQPWWYLLMNGYGPAPPRQA